MFTIFIILAVHLLKPGVGYRILVHSDDVITNSSSYKYDVIDITTSGLRWLAEFAEGYANHTGTVSFLGSNANSLLNVYFEDQNFHLFNLDKPQLQENLFSEHDAFFPYQTNSIVQNIIHDRPERLCIISYVACTDQIIQTLIKDFQRNNIPSLCRVYDPFHTGEMSVATLIRHVKIWDYTHLLLLLSSSDVEDLVGMLNVALPETVFRAYTLLPDNNAFLSYPNIFNMAIEKLHIPAARFHIDQSILGGLEELINSQEKKLSIRNSINDKLRATLKLATVNQTNPNGYFHKTHHDTWLNRVRAITVLSYPYNKILPNVPTVYGKCEYGYQCHAPRTRKNATTIWEPRCCDGITIALFQILSDELNFKYDIYITEDGKFGGIDENGTWNGMIGQLAANRADVAVSGFEPTRPRIQVVNFTPGYMSSYTAFVIQKPSRKEISFINWEFVRSMDTGIAYGILLSTILSGLFIIMSENVGYLIRDKSHFSTREVMTYIFGLTFQRDMGGRNPLKWAGRVAALGYAAAMTIIMTTYTAHLTAKSIQLEIADTFKGIEDDKIVHPTGDFKFSVIKDTSTESRFKDGSPSHRNIWKFMRNYFVQNYSEGIEKVYTGEYGAFVSDDISVQTLLADSKYCSSLTLYKQNTTHNDVTLAYRKGFLLGEDISRVILKLRERGVIESLIQKWVYTPQCTSDKMDKFLQFDINYFGGIIFIVGILLLVSIIIIFLENLYTYLKVKRAKTMIGSRNRTVTVSTNC